MYTLMIKNYYTMSHRIGLRIIIIAYTGLRNGLCMKIRVNVYVVAEVLKKYTIAF